MNSLTKNPKCSGCYCYWKPTDDDIKAEYCKACKKKDMVNIISTKWPGIIQNIQYL